MRIAALLIAATAVYGKSLPTSVPRKNGADTLIIATVDSLDVANSNAFENELSSGHPENNNKNDGIERETMNVSVESVEVSSEGVGVSVEGQNIDTVVVENVDSVVVEYTSSDGSGGVSDEASYSKDSSVPLDVSIDSVEISNGDVGVTIDGKDIESLTVENVHSVAVDVSEADSARENSNVASSAVLPVMTVDSVEISNGDVGVAIDGKDIESLTVENVDSVSVDIDQKPLEALNTALDQSWNSQYNNYEFNECLEDIMTMAETEADRLKIGLRLLDAAKFMLDPREHN